MSKIVRCKMQIQSLGASQYDSNVSVLVAQPVTSGSEENEQFFEFTPGGQLSLDVVRHKTLAHLKEGDEIYVDITVADPPVG